MSDVTGLVAAFMAWRATQRDVHTAKQDGEATPIETAKAKHKENFYSMLKLMADVATYAKLPVASAQPHPQSCLEDGRLLVVLAQVLPAVCVDDMDAMVEQAWLA
jgi:hypothetical protein